jgi:hypothetical protein
MAGEGSSSYVKQKMSDDEESGGPELDLIKYEKKLTKALKKRKLSSDENEFGDLDGKIKKYEKKIARARLSYDDSFASSKLKESHLDSAAAAPHDQEIDKSGMSLLLFYAYVEPVWRPAQHSTMIEWARSTLESNGWNLRLFNYC